MARVEPGHGATCKACGGVSWLLLQADSQKRVSESGKTYLILLCNRPGCGNAAEVVATSIRWMPNKVEIQPEAAA